MKNEFNNLKKKYFVISEEELFEIIRRASAITAKMMIGSNVFGYFGDIDPRFGHTDPLGGLGFKEHDRLTILQFFS